MSTCLFYFVIFNTLRALLKEKADFANIERMIMCTNKDFVSTLIFRVQYSLKSTGITENLRAHVCLFPKFVFTATAT